MINTCHFAMKRRTNLQQISKSKKSK